MEACTNTLYCRTLSSVQNYGRDATRSWGRERRKGECFHQDRSGYALVTSSPHISGPSHGKYSIFCTWLPSACCSRVIVTVVMWWPGYGTATMLNITCFPIRRKISFQSLDAPLRPHCIHSLTGQKCPCDYLQMGHECSSLVISTDCLAGHGDKPPCLYICLMNTQDCFLICLVCTRSFFMDTV